MDTSHMTRHVGKVANTDQRIVVVFMQLPQRPDHALVVPVDNLPPRFEQAIMDILKTPEGQQAMPFADALHRHRMPDTGETILEALHNQGKLVPVPVRNILMLPTPSQPIKLSYILEQQGSLQQAVPTNYETEKFNPHLNNQQAETSEKARDVARGLIIEAEMLESEAKRKREQAYGRDPALNSPILSDVKAYASSNPWTSTAANQPVSMTEIAQGLNGGGTPLETRLDNVETMIGNLENTVNRFMEIMAKTSTETPETSVVNDTSEQSE